MPITCCSYPSGTLRKPAQSLLWCLQLVGYYGAALSVDYRWLGRKKLTSFSFLWVSPCSACLLKTCAQEGLHGLECNLSQACKLSVSVLLWVYVISSIMVFPRYFHALLCMVCMSSVWTGATPVPQS